MSARGWLGGVLLSLLAACASTTRAPGGDATFRAVSGWRGASDPLSLTMRALAGRLESAGLTPEPEAFSGFLTAGSRGTHAIELPPNTCRMLFAIASEGIQDMDASLYSPEGDVLAVDSQPDAHPTLQICSADAPRRVYYTLQIYEGAGTFLMATFVGARASLEPGAKLVGARVGVAELGGAVVPGPGRVSAFRDGVLRRGFALVQSPLRVPLVAQQRMRAVVSVEPGGCYTAAGFAFDGLSGVALRVLDEEGVEVARDASEQEDVAAQFCADRSAEFAAELQGVEGHGSALLLLFRADAGQIGGRAGLWLGERPLARAASASLPQAIAAVSRRAEEDGFKGARTVHSGQLGPGAATEQVLALPAQRCVRVHAVGGPGIRRLQLVVADANGRHLSRGEGDAETTYVHVCSSSARELALQVHAASGSGAFVIRVHEAPLAGSIPEGGDEELAAELLQVMRLARDLGYRPSSDFEDPRRVRLEQAQPISIKLAPEPIRCVRAYVLSTGQARGELLRAGKQLGAAIPDRGEPARFCTGKDSVAAVDSLELRLSTPRGKDDAWVMVLVR